MRGIQRIGIGVAAGLCLIWMPVAWATEADEIVAKHIEARGGADKIKAVESARISGKMSMPQAGQEVPFVWKWKRPNKFRTEFTLQGMTGIQAFDGETAWTLMPFAGQTDPQKVPAEEAKLVEEQADFDGPFIDTEEKGYKIEYLGEEEAEGTPCHKFKITNKHGDVSYAFLDAEYFLQIRSEAKREVQGMELELEASQGDYKEVDGLMFAHSVESKPKGAPAGRMITFEKIELGVEIDDSEFVMPEPEKPAEEEKEEQPGTEE